MVTCPDCFENGPRADCATCHGTNKCSPDVATAYWESVGLSRTTQMLLAQEYYDE